MTDIKEKYSLEDINWYEKFWKKLIDILKEKYKWHIKLKVSSAWDDFHYVCPTKLTGGTLSTMLTYKNGKRVVTVMLTIYPDVDDLDEPTDNITVESDNVEEVAEKLNQFAFKLDEKIREFLKG